MRMLIKYMYCCPFVFGDPARHRSRRSCRTSKASQCLLYFVDRASRYTFLLITNLTHLFMYLFISCLYMFRASQCSSSGDRIVLIHHLVWLVCVSDCLVCRSAGNCSSLLTGIPRSHLHWLIIPDDVLIQFDLLMMSIVMLETCRDMK